MKTALRREECAGLLLAVAVTIATVNEAAATEIDEPVHVGV
jgi:hypothetical protein